MALLFWAKYCTFYLSLNFLTGISQKNPHNPHSETVLKTEKKKEKKKKENKCFMENIPG